MLPKKGLDNYLHFQQLALISKDLPIMGLIFSSVDGKTNINAGIPYGGRFSERVKARSAQLK
jgi:hypothetical protein